MARFCASCGLRLEGGGNVVPVAERRHICVLFCDLVGSTPLSHALDAEDLRDVIASYQRTCEAVVARHGGFVAQYRGDSLEVYFGYPHSREDDAARAVRCALEILDAMRQLAAAMNLNLQVRIGIDSGRVVVGPLDSSSRPERVAIGETPNIAARAQSEAAPGEAVVTESLRRLLPPSIAVESIGIRALKGVDRPIELFRLMASSSHPGSRSAPRTPFIGRGGQRQRIRDLWARAKVAGPQFVLLRGEAGIGKSRLVDVARDDLHDEVADVLTARCTPFTADSALHPIIELIGSRWNLEAVPAEERVARVAERMDELGIDRAEAVPLLASFLSLPIDPRQWPAPALSPVRARQRTMEILIEATFALTRGGPVLFVIEDLHWADPSSLELLQQLIASPRTAPVMMLLTARPEFAPVWLRASNVSEIELDPLGPAESESFIRKIARDKPLPPEIAWQIRERAAGNPLFLEEITRSVVESGALVEREHAWELVRALSAEVVPASMEASLMARIDRLGEAKPLLLLASTLGREFSQDLLLEVAQLPDEVLARQLGTILQSGLVYRHPGATAVYTFKHILVCDKAYDSLLRSTRQHYHARIADVLQERFPQLVKARPELLAHHLSGASRHAEAAVHWQSAGENAARRTAVNEAVAYLRRALADLARLREDTTRMERELSILAALAPVLMAVYGWAAPEVGDACERAIALAGRLGAQNRIYPLLWGLWTNQFVGGRLDQAMESAGRVLAMALPTGAPMLEITARHATSYTHYYRGEYDAAIAEAEAGLRHYRYELELDIAQTFQLSSSICSMTARASALWMQGRQREGIAHIEEMVAVARSLRHPPSLAAALAFAMFFFLYDRDWARLLAFADETYFLSQAEGFAMWTANAGMHRGRARIGLGELDSGIAEVLEWGALFRQTGSGVIEGSSTSMVSEAMHMAGRSNEALMVSSEGEQRAQAGVVRVMMPEIFRTRGNILRDLGRWQEAADAYGEAVANARAQGARSLELRALTALLELQLSLQRPGTLPAELRRLTDELEAEQGRPDLVAARAVLDQVSSEPPPVAVHGSPP